VVDLRKVNDILKPMTVMLPRIDDVLQEIASQKPTVYSSLDLYLRDFGQYLWKRTAENTRIFIHQNLEYRTGIVLYLWV